MQKNIWQQLVAVIIFIWALWNYEITLSLLGSALGILMPLITGCVIAFTVNVFIEKFEQIWMRVLKDRAARFRGPVCLIAGFMLIFGVITALLFAVLPELHASIVILSHKLPQDIVYFNAFLQEQLLSWNFSPEDVAYVQDKIYEWQAAAEAYWQANKAALLSQTLSITASVAGVVANLVMGFVFAVYILLEKKQLAVSSRRTLYAFCSAERARYIIAAASLAKRICSGFIGGQLLEAFLLGLMCFAGMIILSIPYAFVISALVACLAVVPYIGSITSAVIGCHIYSNIAAGKSYCFHYLFPCTAAYRRRYSLSENCRQIRRPAGAVAACCGYDRRRAWRHYGHDYKCALMFCFLCAFQRLYQAAVAS